ncbi:hypothetical protein [Streptomyces sp. NPDC001933]|uniref:hypothetical protein n=1 Tax=Streptomyces sp. NPDC001933 TaxID=3364626 RepID=UPI0036854468
MPPPFDGHLRTLHAEAMERDTAAEHWLFPGRFPAKHLSSSRLTGRLRLLGVRPRTARNIALIELASEPPASSSAACSASTRTPPTPGTASPARTTPTPC